MAEWTRRDTHRLISMLYVYWGLAGDCEHAQCSLNDDSAAVIANSVHCLKTPKHDHIVTLNDLNHRNSLVINYMS